MWSEREESVMMLSWEPPSRVNDDTIYQDGGQKERHNLGE